MIVRGTILSHPLWVVELAAHNVWVQLQTFGTVSRLSPMVESGRPAGRSTALAIKRFLPAEYAAYTASCQSTDQLHIGTLGQLHSIVAWAGIAAFAPMLMVFARRGDRMMLQLMLVVGAGLLINAFVCGAIAGPSARYQSRVVWLVAFTALVAIARLVDSYRSARRSSHAAALPSGVLEGE